MELDLTDEARFRTFNVLNMNEEGNRVQSGTFHILQYVCAVSYSKLEEVKIFYDVIGGGLTIPELG